MPHFEGLGGNLAVVAKAPIERVSAFARDKGSKHIRLLSAANNTFKRDYHGEDADGQQAPITTVFKRWPDGAIRLHWASELLFQLGGSGSGHAAHGHCRAALDAVRPDARRTARETPSSRWSMGAAIRRREDRTGPPQTAAPANRSSPMIGRPAFSPSARNGCRP